MSLKFQALWMRLREPATDLAVLRAEFASPSLRLHPGTDLVCCDYSAPDQDSFGDRDLRRESATYGEAFFLAVQANVGFLHYVHWREGELLRALRAWTDTGWDRAEGRTEPWEEGVLFRPAELADRLASLAGDHPDDPERVRRERETLEDAWRRRAILLGTDVPWCRAEQAAMAVAAHFGFPLRPS